ncbi:hypothetical protein [Nocardia ignorata]|uniref:Uncharacterized protein n=1 Tax=Nocardia ignorata TaxID=145285 RepID=A0A4R6P0R9_NOCIG|nr:hypothetical protein [Nocardia ignorata]TDP29872.1 hypothetical protein DFR75_112141 [Nocardia ignorata]
MADLDLDDLVGEWHDSDDPRPLAEYLGMTPWLYNAWVERPEEFGTVSTLDECAANYPHWRVIRMFVVGELADQVRSRLNGQPEDRVWASFAYDIGRAEAVLSFDCYTSPTQIKDVSFVVGYLGDKQGRFTDVRAWLDGDADA